ncbi:MAG: lipoate--protein ligase family protein [Planctomycetota bacterium]|jgi:lipoate-protein ligase A
MARDEAMLLSVARDGGMILRFYGWRPHAFSLGYFQRWGDFSGFAAEGKPVVRRPSGGGAIWHADEITYALAARCGEGAFPGRSADILAKVHRCLCAGLDALGVAATLSDGPAGASPAICFSRPQRYDLVVGGRKLLGSAQRRARGAFLQHGSLPLSPNEFAPEAVSLCEVLGQRPGEGSTIAALVEGFERVLGLCLTEAVFSPWEEATAARLEAEKYSRDEWNRRR